MGKYVAGRCFRCADLRLPRFADNFAPQLTADLKPIYQLVPFHWLTFGSAILCELESTINAHEGSDDYPSAALPLLPSRVIQFSNSIPMRANA